MKHNILHNKETPSFSHSDRFGNIASRTAMGYYSDQQPDISLTRIPICVSQIEPYRVSA